MNKSTQYIILYSVIMLNSMIDEVKNEYLSIPRVSLAPLENTSECAHEWIKHNTSINSMSVTQDNLSVLRGFTLISSLSII
jgi:hypothetical protein